jgi:Mlc titration factor MtfA (ptsG expression regulator)
VSPAGTDRALRLALGGVLVAAGGTVGALAAGWAGAGGGVLLGAAGAAALVRSAARRAARRAATLDRPFPEAHRQFLAEQVDFYDRLPPALRSAFERGVALFLAERRITGVGLVADEELRLLVAASAVTLSLGWPEFDWGHCSEVLLYPDDFNRDYGFERAELAGQTHPWGTVILSVPALLQSFEVPDDAFHVGIHEFAHLLDVEQASFDGVPSGLSRQGGEAWAELMKAEMQRLRRGKSVFDRYGEEDPVEFFAVAVEAFFEVPQEVRRRHREVYEALAAYFRQDPAAWDDARLG